jgi:CIC family chloride channel protein
LLGALLGLAAAVFVRGLSYAEDVFELIKNPYLRNIVGMLMIGVLIYALLIGAGHYYVEGVGYSTIQAILNGDLGIPALLVLLFAAKLCATSVSLGAGASGGIFSPSLFMGATLGGGFGALLQMIGVPAPVSIPAFAMVGMGAMVGGGTGAVMTAVVMVFEMTLSYDIIMPMIVAVAMSVGVRRMLSRETIYTLKLVRRGQHIPKARHANMFLVRRAKDVMDPDVLVLPRDASFDQFLTAHGPEGRMRHVVVTDKGRIFGVIRVNTGLRRGLASAHTGITLGDVASRDFTVVGEDAVAFDVINRMWRKGAIMAIVVRGSGVPHGEDVAGIVSKEHVADSVAESVTLYPT